eukprot:TRINITY_DN465_c0_g2_i1.p1 TRINITY_DN465_c0_g2~~TRINITY_DN465_c0_g2_i1.p1  ORF type:complete len:162 (-),score=14.27 TRINITY_DN465_c0_g2_i1:339-824(-)
MITCNCYLAFSTDHLNGTCAGTHFDTTTRKAAQAPRNAALHTFDSYPWDAIQGGNISNTPFMSQSSLSDLQPISERAAHNHPHLINLRLDENYCSSWNENDAVREIIQNFLDGLLSASNVQRRNVRFYHKKQDNVITWTAKASPKVTDNLNPEIGRIEWDR